MVVSEVEKVNYPNNKSILISGVNGAIGSFIYNRFFEDYSITGVGYRDNSNKENYFLDLAKENDVNTFIEQSKKYDVLIFLVGLTHKKGKNHDLDEFRCVNKKTLTNLLSTLKI